MLEHAFAHNRELTLVSKSPQVTILAGFLLRIDPTAC